MDSGIDPEQLSRDSKKFKWILLFAVLLGFTLFFLIVAWVEMYGGGISFNTNGLLGVHISYMIFYLLIVHPISSTIYRLFSTTVKNNVKILHVGIHFIVIIGASVGLGSIIYIHSLDKSACQFCSLHSWLGITAFSIYILQFFVGTVLFLFQIPSETTQECMLPVHRATGLLVLTLTSGAVLTGIFDALVMNKIIATDSLLPVILLNLSALLVILYAFTMGYLLTDYLFRRPIYPQLDRTLSRSELIKVYSASGMQQGTKEVPVYGATVG